MPNSSVSSFWLFSDTPRLILLCGTVSAMHRLKIVALVVGVVVVAALVVVGVNVFVSGNEVAEQQKQLQPFYDVAGPIPAGSPGNLIKYEPIAGLAISGANAFRVLYGSQDPDGTARVTSGMVFIPTAAAPATGRPVVAWAHGTTGLGPQCAPSRSGNVIADMDWLQGMLDKGWIVTATDYSGLGTAGTSLYLVGQAEARDVINSVRVVGSLPNSHAGSRYAVWGHSQGGNSALFVGEISATYAPELTLVGVATAAPAVELASLLSQQWKLPMAWIIGSQVMVSWPTVNPALTAAQVASPAGLANYQTIAMDCLMTGGLTGTDRVHLGQQIFKQDPTTQPDWSAMMAAQTPVPLPPAVPVFIAQSSSDGVVLANSIALMQDKWCKAGSVLSIDWLGPLATGSDGPIATHSLEAIAAGPAATAWIHDRFNSLPAPNTCDVPPPPLP